MFREGTVVMVIRIIFKLLFKATVPIVCMVGIMSYGFYMKGGDPGAVFKKLIGSSIQSAKTSVQDAGDSITSVSPIKSSNKTTVYKWVDANGVTQFGSAPPAGIAAESKTYNNNANLMAAQKPIPRAEIDNSEAVQPGMLPNGERMPGVAGMNLPTAIDPETLSGFLQTMQQQQ